MEWVHSGVQGPRVAATFPQPIIVLSVQTCMSG